MTNAEKNQRAKKLDQGIEELNKQLVFVTDPKERAKIEEQKKPIIAELKKIIAQF